MTSGLRRPHPDKTPRAFVSALSAASLYDPKTQRDGLHWPLSHPRVSASQRLNAQRVLQLDAYLFHTIFSFRRTFVNKCADFDVCLEMLRYQAANVCCNVCVQYNQNAH